MTKRQSNNFENVLLTIELLKHIPFDPQRITAQKLTNILEELGYSRDQRTIQRLLQSILNSRLGLDVDDDQKPYQYYWAKNKKTLVPPSLTPAESLLINLAEQHIKHLIPSDLGKHLNHLFKQASESQSDDLQSQWCQKIFKMDTGQPLLPPAIPDEVFEQVTHALYHNQWLKISYKKPQQKASSKEIKPLGLVQVGVRLYLIAQYENNEMRNFALHRIQRAQPIAHKHFTPSADFNLSKYCHQGYLEWGQGELVKLTFHIKTHAGRHLEETKLSEDQIIKVLDDDYLQVTATVYDNAVLRRWLYSFDNDITRVLTQPITVE